MSAQSDPVKVLEQCQIAAPPNSVPTTSFLLTLMDIHWLYERPSECLFMYQIPLSAAEFTERILPVLKNSLSLALQLFFPLCGNLACPPHPSEPYILYNDGDSVPFLVAQSTGAFSDFLEFGRPRHPKDIHLLVPQIPPTCVLDDTLVELTPLLAVQVTVFPNSGVGIGITHGHIAADGVSFFHFVKTWASICKAKCDMSNVSISIPVHDKGIIKDPNGIKDIVLNIIRGHGPPTGRDSTVLPQDSVRSTFTLSRNEIDQLKKWVVTKRGDGIESAPNVPFSSYAVTSAFLWVCIIKSLDMISAADSSKEGELCHFGVVADCRNKYDSGIPAMFFGNCVTGTLVSVARSKFRQEDSVAVVAEAISHGVRSLNREVLYGDLNEFSKWANAIGSGEHILTVAGSPRAAVYETDFGWGRPGKFEAVHIDISGSIALFDSGKEKGGIEIGLCRSKHQMEVFTSVFQAGMNQFLSME